MRIKPAVLLIGATVLVAAGCGSSSKKAATTTPTTTAAAATTTTTAASTTTTLPTKLSFANTKNCLQLAGLGAQVAKSMQPTGGDLQATVENQAKALQALAKAAPAEIRDDFLTYATAFSTYGEALAKAGFKPGTTPTGAQLAQLSVAVKALTTAKVQAASQHLAAWTQKNCSVKP